MKKLWRELKPKNFTEGLVIALSLALVVATAVLVVGSKNSSPDFTNEPQSDIKLEARETTFNDPFGQSDMPAKTGENLSNISHRIASSLDTWQRNLPGKVQGVMQDLNMLHQLPREIMDRFQNKESLFTDKVDQEQLEDIEQIMSDTDGLSIAEPNLPPAVEENPPMLPSSPPAVQETPAVTQASQSTPKPAATVWDSPYAPTAPQSGDNPNNYSSPYAPTAPQQSGNAQPTNMYAPAPPSSPDQGEEPQGPVYAPPADQNPATNPTVMPTSQQIAQVQAEVMAKINAARVAAGIPALQANSTIQGIANFRAQELSTYYHPKHYRADGSYALTWIANNWGGKYGIGENIGWIDNISSLNANTIFKAFYNSGKGHREIMLHPSLKIGAVGIYCVPGPVADNNTGSPNETNKGRIFISMNFGY
ncbi:MAG: CAP domain-containing protein [Eubacteriales bacterium]|nr:CAP domain-containing protein [Eubacteriales bacterium]